MAYGVQTVNQAANKAANQAMKAKSYGSRAADSANGGIELVAPFIANHEGYRKDAYWDDIGKKWTVGHGHTYIKDPKTGKTRPVVKGDTLDEGQSLDLVKRKVRDNAVWIYKNLEWSRNLNANQLASLYDIAYNGGVGLLRNAKGASPGLNKEMSAPGANYNEILKRHIPTYSYANKKWIRGLYNRRMDAIRDLLGNQ